MFTLKLERAGRLLSRMLTAAHGRQSLRTLGLGLGCLGGGLLPPAVGAPPAPSSFVGAVWNPEDLLSLPGTPWVVVSAMRSNSHHGGLLLVDQHRRSEVLQLYPTQQAVPGAPAAATFSPHGIGLRVLGVRRFELLVVDHGAGEAITHFELQMGDQGPPQAVRAWRTTLPPGVWANSVVAMPDGGFAITSMFDPRDASLMSHFAAAEPTGAVWRWSDAMGWRELSALPLSGANGIAVSDDGALLYVTEWAARRIWRMASDGSGAVSVQTPFLPDNLRWTADGQLLTAGQWSAPEQVSACEAQQHTCPMAYAVAKLDPRTLRMTLLLQANEADAARDEFGGATGALQLGAQIWVGSFTGQRISVFECPGCVPFAEVPPHAHR